MEKSKDAANKLMVEAGGAVGGCIGGTLAQAAASAVAASTTPVVTHVFAGTVFASGGAVAASPALVLLAAHPLCAIAIGTAALAVGAYKFGEWLLED